jgi:hypothetical protein
MVHQRSETMIRTILGVLLALMAPLPLDAMACDIVYGDGWAFVSTAPEGWNAACGEDATDGTALTLWPSDQAPEAAHALIYVAVSDKRSDTLSSFIEGEVAGYREAAPDAGSLSVGPIQDVSPTRRMIHYGNATGGRDELVEYIEGPSAFFIAVLTTESPSATERYKAAFESFLGGFLPSSLKRDGD